MHVEPVRLGHTKEIVGLWGEMRRKHDGGEGELGLLGGAGGEGLT